MNKNTFVYLRAFLAFSALIGFIFLYGRALIDAFGAATTPAYSEAYIYVATILAGLVGGVAATGLGQSAPGTPSYSARHTIFATLGNILAPFQPDNLQKTLAVLFTVVYIAAGLTALLAWVSARPEVPVHEMIKNLGLIFLGLGLATAQAFFGIEPKLFNPRLAAKKRH
jgi:hypothetical protein